MVGISPEDVLNSSSYAIMKNTAVVFLPASVSPEVRPKVEYKRQRTESLSVQL